MANLNPQAIPIQMNPACPLAGRRIRVLLGNAHAIVHIGIAGMLATYTDIELVGDAMSERDLHELCLSLKPDVILLDLLMLEMNGTPMIRRIARQMPQVNIIALSIHDDGARIKDILRAGASSYLCKAVTAQELATTIRATACGRVPLAPEVARFLVRQENHPFSAPLTAREQETLALLVQGRSNRQIAQQLSVSPHTVKNHVRNILQKLHAANRTEAAILAVKHRLVANK
ncbi:MAG: response regulator transcription factor [Caldilineaceae bacterium]|nr:response regulator transcription factor [Caldilineaceae bacterium]